MVPYLFLKVDVTGGAGPSSTTMLSSSGAGEKSHTVDGGSSEAGLPEGLVIHEFGGRLREFLFKQMIATKTVKSTATAGNTYAKSLMTSGWPLLANDFMVHNELHSH